jgi:Uma2 family endonuclease
MMFPEGKSEWQGYRQWRSPMALDSETVSMRVMLADEETDIDLAPLQGLWTVEQYLRLTNQTNRLIEFTDGTLEVLPMPTKYHQAILRLLFLAFLPVMQQIGGDVYFAPLRLQIRQGKLREPDLLLVLDKSDPRAQNEFWLGADLVVEIVSPDHPERDTEQKRREYAEAGIAEYWVVNPINQLDQTITVLTLDGTSYREHGVFHRGQQAASKLLADFAISVDEVFDAQ